MVKKCIVYSIASFKNMNLHVAVKKSESKYFPSVHFLWKGVSYNIHFLMFVTIQSTNNHTKYITRNIFVPLCFESRKSSEMDFVLDNPPFDTTPVWIEYYKHLLLISPSTPAPTPDAPSAPAASTTILSLLVFL